MTRARAPLSVATSAARLFAAVLMLAGVTETRAATGDLIWTFADLELISACTRLASDRESVLAYSWTGQDPARGETFTGRLRSLDVVDGSLLWQAPDGPEEFPVDLETQSGLVLTTSWREARPGTTIGTVHVRARDLATGDPVWSQSLEAGRFFYESTAIAADARTTAVVGARRTPARPLDIFDYFVAAYDTLTGAALWQRAFDVDGDWDRAEAVAVGQGAVASGGRITDGNLDFFHVRVNAARTGRLLWEDSVDGGEVRALAIRAGLLYVVGRAGFTFADGSHLRIYRLATGELVAARSIRRGWMEHLEILGPRVIVAGSRSRGLRAEVRAYDRELGRLLWRSRQAKSAFAGLVTRRNRVYGVGFRRPSSAFVRSWKAGSGRLRWSDEVGKREEEALGCSIASAGGRVIAAFFENRSMSSDPTLPRQVLRAYVP